MECTLTDQEVSAILKGCAVYPDPILKDFYLKTVLQPNVSKENFDSCLKYLYNLGGRLHGQSENKEMALSALKQIATSPFYPQESLIVVFNTIINLSPSDDFIQDMGQFLTREQKDAIVKHRSQRPQSTLP